MKKILFLFVVMLGTLGAYAQSNTTPIKGDVNEDGVVDIADINAIIGIKKNGGGTSGDTKYYWYVGTTKPTSLSEATVVDSYPAEYTFTNPSMEEKCYVYVLTNADKDVVISDPADPFIPLTKAEDTSTINGYKIVYLSADGTTPSKIAKGGSVIIHVLDDGWKHFYIGTTQPTSENYKSLTPQYSSLSDMNGATVHVPSNGKIYVMLPYQDSPNQSQIKKVFTDNEGNIVTCINRTGDEQTIPFHMIWELTFESGTTLTFKDPTTEDTAVEGVKSDMRTNAVIYNVRGQRLTSPQKGINIIDNRKVIVR